MIQKEYLVHEYIVLKKSAHEIAIQLGCSDNKVTYWLQKHGISKRSISEAVYQKNNPNGDPFTFAAPKQKEDWFLYGLGIGLFWGEGNKANKHSIRLGNTDPALIKAFIIFLEKIFTIDVKKLRFGLQIFEDVDPNEALQYWMNALGVNKNSFYKVTVTPSRKKGTYRNKNKHGVLTVYFSNMKLRDSIVSAILALQKNSYANVAQSVERIHGKS